ncbi:hypothetical protein [Facklamia sp. P9177]|uniref:hypothetical protein n=1 Tax=Facklamia sp. P9177 TaxID=3421945 RepID=UPI003D167D05
MTQFEMNKKAAELLEELKTAKHDISYTIIDEFGSPLKMNDTGNLYDIYAYEDFYGVYTNEYRVDSRKNNDNEIEKAIAKALEMGSLIKREELL